MKATVQLFIYFHRDLSTPVMCTDSSQVGVVLLPSFNIFLTIHSKRIYSYLHKIHKMCEFIGWAGRKLVLLLLCCFDVAQQPDYSWRADPWDATDCSNLHTKPHEACYMVIGCKNYSLNIQTTWKGKWKLLPKIEEIIIGQVHGNLSEIFWRTQPSFSIRESECMSTHDKDGITIFVVCSHTFTLSSDWERRSCLSKYFT